MFIDWNKVRESIVISCGYSLDAYGDLFALNRLECESCEEFRVRVLYVFDINIGYLMS